MSVLNKIFNVRYVKKSNLYINCYCTTSKSHEEKNNDDGEFRVLYLRGSNKPKQQRPTYKKQEAQQPRSQIMATDQDWASVWPGPRSFHPATVPLPLRQGYTKNKSPAPNKYGNAELMKIPNFLHLTPPVVKRQCEALKQFCTSWPKELTADEQCETYFPLEIISSNYCHSSPTIRDPLARIVTLKVKLASFKLDQHAKDKFLRLVGDRYHEKTDTLTIVTDRCPLRKQNYEYAMYLITALYHESWNVEPWEALKSEADMEYYDWSRNVSKTTIEAIFNKPTAEINGAEEYSVALTSLMNEGENDYTLRNYGESVRKLLGVPILKNS